MNLRTDKRALPVAWLMVLVGLGCFVWLPGQQRLAEAERQVAEVQRLSRQARQLTPLATTAVERPVSAANLNERAQAAGLRILNVEVQADELSLDLAGEGAALMQWLHDLEWDGARLSTLQLQPEGEALHAHMTLHLATRER